MHNKSALNEEAGERKVLQVMAEWGAPQVAGVRGGRHCASEILHSSGKNVHVRVLQLRRRANGASSLRLIRPLLPYGSDWFRTVPRGGEEVRGQGAYEPAHL